MDAGNLIMIIVLLTLLVFCFALSRRGRPRRSRGLFGEPEAHSDSTYSESYGQQQYHHQHHHHSSGGYHSGGSDFGGGDFGGGGGHHG
jgi:uncharacterized membrane protein YgcG